jgi:hypothetical protein
MAVARVISNGAPPRSCMDAGSGTSCGAETAGVGLVETTGGELHDTASAPTPNTIANIEDFRSSPANMKQLRGKGRVANVFSCGLLRVAVIRASYLMPQEPAVERVPVWTPR